MTRGILWALGACVFITLVVGPSYAGFTARSPFLEFDTASDIAFTILGHRISVSVSITPATTAHTPNESLSGVGVPVLLAADSSSVFVTCGVSP